MPLVLDNPEVKRLHNAIVQLAANNVPPSRAVTQLYDRWLRFLQSGFYKTLPNTALYPIFKAFAATYVATCISLGRPRESVDPSLLVLAAVDANNTVVRAGRALDAALGRARPTLGAITTTWRPLVLVVAGALAIVWVARGSTHGRRSDN